MKSCWSIKIFLRRADDEQELVVVNGNDFHLYICVSLFYRVTLNSSHLAAHEASSIHNGNHNNNVIHTAK